VRGPKGARLQPSLTIILRLKTSGLGPAMDGRLPRVQLCHPSTADPLPRIRLCHPSTAGPLPRIRLCRPSTAEPLRRIRLCHPSTADPLPRSRLCHPSTADPNLPLRAIFVCLGACLHAPICFWERSSSPWISRLSTFFRSAMTRGEPSGKENGAWRHAPRRGEALTQAF
jgi:hypothetical protein